MNKPEKVLGAPCAKCGVPTTWVSVELVGNEPVNVFHCDGCDKLSAEATTKKGLEQRA